MTDDHEPDESLSDRRSFLIRSAATVAGSLLVAPGCAGGAQTDAPALTGSPTPSQMSDFVAVGSALLGIDAAMLAPNPDAGDMKSEVFGAAQRSNAAQLGRMLAIYDAHRSNGAAEIVAAIARNAGPEMEFFAKAVALAWLLGSWYDPVQLRAAGGDAGAPVTSTVISANAYRESWAWKIAQTKPMGTSSQGFGYWSAPPAALSAFVGGER